MAVPAMAHGRDARATGRGTGRRPNGSAACGLGFQPKDPWPGRPSYRERPYGRGCGAVERPRHNASGRGEHPTQTFPLTPALSPEYGGEGAREAARQGSMVAPPSEGGSLRFPLPRVRGQGSKRGRASGMNGRPSVRRRIPPVPSPPYSGERGRVRGLLVCCFGAASSPRCGRETGHREWIQWTGWTQWTGVLVYFVHFVH